MKKVTIKNLVDFRRKKSEQSKKTFVNNLKKEKPKKEEDKGKGGDYWSIATHAIANVFRYKNLKHLDNKIVEFEEKILKTQRKQTKDQFNLNIDILLAFREFNFESIRPNANLEFLAQSNEKKLINITGLPIQAWPHHVFTFSENGREEIGAIWFVAIKNGYEMSELGMFADILYRYLNTHFSKDYYVNPDYCIAVDVTKSTKISYSDIEKGDVPVLIERALEEIKKLNS